jgi:hypothetical protein
MTKLEKVYLVTCALDEDIPRLASCDFLCGPGCSNLSTRLFEFRYNPEDEKPVYCTPCEKHLPQFLNPRESRNLANGWEEIK